MLAHIDWIESFSWWRFVGCTSRARSSCSTTSQRCGVGSRYNGWRWVGLGVGLRVRGRRWVGLYF